MFELLNTKWGEPTFGTPSGTITWSSELGGALTLGAGATDASILSTFQSALQSWENVAAVEFQQVANGADFTVGGEVLDPNFAGVATYGPNLAGLNSLNDASISFNSQYVWSDNGGAGTTDFYAVALHEIGHVIGLDHPSDPSQIMNGTIFVDDLGNGDIAGAQFIYGTDGADVPVEAEGPKTSAGSGGGGGGGALGLIVAIVALIAGLFTGGAGAAVAMAAGRVYGDDEDDEAADNDAAMAPDLTELFGTHDDCATDGIHSHGVAIDDFTMIPTVDFTAQANACGCYGLCEHIIDGDEPVEEFLV